MGQYLGGAINVVVGAYTGNWWEVAGGVMQIVGTKEKNTDLQTAGAVVGMVGAIGSTYDMVGTNQAWGIGNTAKAANVGQAISNTSFEATGGVSNAALSGDSSLQAAQAVQTAQPASQALDVANKSQQINDTKQTLSAYDKITNALSSPIGLGAIAGVGAAYGNISAAQTMAETNAQMHANQLALERQRMAIANTVGTGVINPVAAPATGLLGTVATPTIAPSLPTTPNILRV